MTWNAERRAVIEANDPIPVDTDPTPNAAQPKSRRRWHQYGLRTLLIVVTLAGCGFGSRPDSKPLRSDVFYLGMSGEEALARLPPGYQLAELSIIYDYGPGGPSEKQRASDEYYGIANADRTEGVPLFFNQEKRLVRVGTGFDEERLRGDVGKEEARGRRTEMKSA